LFLALTQNLWVDSYRFSVAFQGWHNLLSSIESDLLLLESNTTLDQNCVNRVFWAIHTIKGAGSFLELDTIVLVSHRAESLLSKIRAGEANTSSANVVVILVAVDALAEMLDLPDLGASHDYSAILSRLGFDRRRADWINDST